MSKARGTRGGIGKRTSNLEVRVERTAVRVATVQDIMLRYPNYAKARQKICDELGVTPRTACKYMRAARKAWEYFGTKDPDAFRAEASEGLRRLIQLSLEKQRALVVEGEIVMVDDPDVKAATGALWRLVQLHGVEPATKVEHSGEIKAKSTEELKTRAMELLGKLGAK